MLMQRKTIFDVIKEADADDVDSITNGSIDAGDAPPEAGADAGADDDGGDDADLNIDASLDGTDDNDNPDEGGNDDFGGGGDSGSSSGGSDFGGGSSSGSTDEEPVKNNTDIFSNLTSEEQAIKIAELKRLYDELYTSCDDYITKFNDIDYDNIPINVVERVSTALGNLRVYMRDYILHVFPIKSYIENDYKYNEFLYVFHSIASILEDIPTTTAPKKS